MIKVSLLIISLLITVSSFAQKGDTVSIQQHVLEREQLKLHFIEPLFLNPSLSNYRYSTSLSTISVKGSYDDQYQSILAQTGDGWKGYQINAQSYVRLSNNSSVWGNAYFKKGERQNVLWNENSDFDKVYPYVMADTIGGDMKSNTYYFNGGYAHKIKKWTFAGEFSYRALMEHRIVDPRPKNTIADLQGRFGVSYEIIPSYALGLSVEAHKYKQNSNIQYFNELGVSKTFHLQGLGTSYIRFDGTRNSVNYQGNLFGASLNLMPIGKKCGWFGSLSYQKYYLDKILPSINDLSLNELNEDGLTVDLGWMATPSSLSQWGVKGHFSFSERKGKEFVYGDASSNQYLCIAVKEPFDRKLLNGFLSAFYERNQSRVFTFGGNMLVGLSSHKEIHKGSLNEMNVDALNFNLSAVSLLKWKSNLLRLKIGGQYQNVLDDNMKIKHVTHPFANDILLRNFSIMSSNSLGYYFSARWSTLVGKDNMLYIMSSLAQKYYKNDLNGYEVTVNIGVDF